MNIVLLAQVIKRPQPLPLRGHGGLYCELVSWCCLCWCSVFQRFKWLSAVSAFDCFSVSVTTQQHLSLVWLRGPQKTRACQVGVLESLPVRHCVDRGGLLSRQGRHRGGHQRLRTLQGVAFEEELPPGDAGKRTLSIWEAIERRSRLFRPLGASRFWEPSASEAESDEVEIVAHTSAVDLTSLQAEHLVPRSRLYNPYVFDHSPGSSSLAAAPRPVPSRADSSVVDTPAGNRPYDILKYYHPAPGVVLHPWSRVDIVYREALTFSVFSQVLRVGER